MDRRRRKIISKLLGFKETKELYYLGNKITLKRRKASDFLGILEKVDLKLDVWGKKFLSTAGRITLIYSALQSITVFYTAMSLVPVSVLKKIDRMSREFIWNKNNGDSGLHFVSWRELCKPKDQGGFGIQYAAASIELLRAKVAWNFLNKQNPIFRKSISAKYVINVWEKEVKPNSSLAWKLLKVVLKL
ncbi:hypothetical protein KFK09_004013 [Dendrobium nobile]|uniref:Uncharacterized protein n=1 Tax=Dendrobium nobile TaxID=94219 RepID=A0A8T3BZ96_DENNO|nr:hypothetical protein KFK09_004013 [Dendrobium nobile]